MLKVMGIIIIIAVCGGVGFYMSSSLRIRQKRLTAICLLIEEISDRIRTGEELSDILNSSGKEAGIFRRGYDTVVSPEGLNILDIRLTEKFFSKLGMGDTDSQIKRCGIYFELLKNKESEAIKQAKEKSALYCKLGVFAGLLIGVLLI